MKSVGRVVSSVLFLSAVAALLECGNGPSLPSPLTITTATLPNGTAETQYSESVQASGGVAPYNWSISAGTLPHNLQLIPSGDTATISGTPDTPVQGDVFSVKVTDAASQVGAQSYKVSILGVPDTLTLSAANLIFSPQLNGTTSATQTTTLTNTGSGSVAINSVVATGNNAGDFSESNTCRSEVAGGANCVITVTFTPSVAGPRVASITINDDTTGTPHQVGLNGIGLTSGPNATLSASSLTFNGQEVGTTSPAQTLTLTNYGEATLNVAGIAASGDFAENNSCGPTLAPGANCPISVSFSPTASGNLAGTLSVNDNVTGSPQTISLNGTGAASGTPVLTGYCVGTLADPNQCGSSLSADCPVGEVAIGPTNMQCGTAGYVNIDNSRGCTGKFRTETFTGRCATGPASGASRVKARSSRNTIRQVEE